MRTIRQLAVPQDTNIARFPEGQIQNETATQEGTPVVREIYGDILANLYKLLGLADITPNGTEDSEETQFQLIQALELFSNKTNDVEQTLSLAATVWSVPLKLSILPDKFVFIGVASDDYDGTETYTFKGSEALVSYPFTSPTGFSSGDNVIVVIDQSGVKAISLDASVISSSGSIVSTAFGNPISYNDSQTMWYYSQSGYLYNEKPNSANILSVIRTDSADAGAIILDVFFVKKRFVVFVWLPATTTYAFWQFDSGNLAVATKITVVGITPGSSNDHKPYCYVSDNNQFYVTNRLNNIADDFEFTILSYDEVSAELTRVQDIAINNAFQKTSNVFFSDDNLYTLIASVLVRYGVLDGTQQTLLAFGALNGQVFSYSQRPYYSNGELGIIWSGI
jgi:hypothetical protein